MIDFDKLMPTNDVIFKAMLGNPKHPKGLIHFLNSALRPKDPIVSIRIENPEILKDHVLEKGSRLDILATTSTDEIINIECQTGNHSSFIARLLYYWSKNFSKQLVIGDRYSDLKRTVSIVVLNFNLLIDDIRYQIKGCIYDCETLTQMTDLLEFHLLDLTKFGGVDENNPVTMWMEFFKNPYSKESELIYKRIPEIKEAKNMFEKVKADPKCRELIQMREDANIEVNSAISSAVEETKKKAEAEKEELKAQAEAEKKELKAQAEAEKKKLKAQAKKAEAQAKKAEAQAKEVEAKAKAEKIESAKKMLIDGLPENMISKYSGLSIEEVIALKKKIL